MSENAKKIITTVCAIVSIGILAGAVKAGSLKHDHTAASAAPRNVTKSELARDDGKNGHKCFVAVDGQVYEIVNSPLWVNGVHTTSDGRAFCGADLSGVIDQAPHGRRILDRLDKIGPLTD